MPDLNRNSENKLFESIWTAPKCCTLCPAFAHWHQVKELTWYSIDYHSDEANIVYGHMAHAQWPTNNLSFASAQPLWFQLRVRSDDRFKPGKRDSSVAMVSISFSENIFFSGIKPL